MRWIYDSQFIVGLLLELDVKMNNDDDSAEGTKWITVWRHSL